MEIGQWINWALHAQGGLLVWRRCPFYFLRIIPLISASLNQILMNIWPRPLIFKTIVLNLTIFYCFPWIFFMSRDFISTLTLNPSILWELTQWWKGDSPLTLWCKPNWESKNCKDQINLPVARIDCQTDGQKRIQFTTNWWMVLHFCPTYGVHDFRVSMEVYHMPTVLLTYQIKKKLPHKSPLLAQIFWVCPEIWIF